MDTKFTPGPWVKYPTGSIISDAMKTPDHTVIRGGNIKGSTLEEVRANANLISAAPEMYASCQSADAHLRLLHHLLWESGAADKAKLNDVATAIKANESILKKARGEA